MNNNLYEVYKKQVVPVVMQELGLKNSMEVPKILKVVVNVVREITAGDHHYGLIFKKL
jgi:ribosomal protein L5